MRGESTKSSSNLIPSNPTGLIFVTTFLMSNLALIPVIFLLYSTLYPLFRPIRVLILNVNPSISNSPPQRLTNEFSLSPIIALKTFLRTNLELFVI